MQEMEFWSLGWQESLEKEIAIHSSILAGKIPWTEESGGLQSTGLQRVQHDLGTEQQQGFPGGSVVKTLPANVGDTGSIPDPGRSPTGCEAAKPTCCNYQSPPR